MCNPLNGIMIGGFTKVQKNSFQKIKGKEIAKGVNNERF